MAARSLCAAIRRRLYAFARDLATPFSDSRRARFVADMIPGLVIANHVHLTKVARALSTGAEDIHGIEKRLSRHLGSEHWDMSPLEGRLLADSAAFVTDDSLIVADTTDLAKYWARKLEGLGYVHDGSDPDKRLAPGYMLLEAYVRVGRWQLFPLLIEPLKTYSGAPTSENAEIIAQVLRVHAATGGKGTWVLDRGFDRRQLFGPLLRGGVAFVARLLGTRHVRAADGRTLAVTAPAEEMRPARRPGPRGTTTCQVIRLPEVGEGEFLLVAHWRRWGREPLLLLVSPQARRPGRRREWFVRAYRRRWGAEDATRGIKQTFAVESFLVRSWRSIRRLLCLVGWAFWWLNLWGQEGYSAWVEALKDHPWRLPKEVVYLFDWIAKQLHFLLHPRPKIEMPCG
jgi:Transposase DDE domain